jgi:cell division protein FtsA
MRLLGIGVADCQALQKGKVTDPDGLAVAIDTAIKRLNHSAKIEATSLIVGVGGPQIEGTVAQGFIPIIPRSRSITREDVLQVINHSRQLMVPPGKEQIQVIPKEFRIDGQGDIQEPVGLSGSRLEVVSYLVFGDAGHVQSLEKAVVAGGRNVDQMVLRPLASALGTMTPEEIRMGAIVVDLGAGSTEIAVMQGGSISFAGSVPVGSALITSDLMQLLKVDREEAERLKVEHGAALAAAATEHETVQVLQAGQTQARPMQRKVLCEIIESRTREIASLVRRELERNGALAKTPGGFVLTGGGAKLPAMDRVFEGVFPHAKIRLAEPNLQGLVETRPGLAAAVGMARYALQVGEDELTPASGIGNWKDRISRIISALSGKA